MADLTNPRVIKLKGALSSALLLVEAPSLRVAMLLGIAIWSFCRADHFAFYVIEHYVDPGFRFSGLGAFVRYLVRRGNRASPGDDAYALRVRESGAFAGGHYFR